MIFTAYAHQGGEVMGIEVARRSPTVRRRTTRTARCTRRSRASRRRDYALVERDLESTATPGPLDIWRLPFDGDGELERLTFFNRYRGGYYASNPTVSPDGKTVAFQLSFDGPVEGAGQGILLFDLEKYEEAR